MSQDTLLYIMAAAVSVSALALVLQMLFLWGVYRETRSLQNRVSQVAPKVESFIASAEQTLKESRAQITQVTTKASEILDLTKDQMQRVQEVIQDASGRAKSQLEHAELVVDDTLSRVHNAVTSVHNGISRPIREIHGVTQGLRAAFGYLLRSTRTGVAEATQDEELFI